MAFLGFFFCGSSKIYFCLILIQTAHFQRPYIMIAAGRLPACLLPLTKETAITCTHADPFVTGQITPTNC
jgi:hypothetical protein